MGKQTHNKKGGIAGRTLVDMDPSTIYFTHSRIRPQFTGCNKYIEDTLDEVVQGTTKIEEIPYITVIENFEEVEEQGGKKKKNNVEKVPFYFSLNNRRLFLFKTLHKQGHIKTIKVYVKPALQREAERYTRDRCAIMAKMMSRRPEDGNAESSAAASPSAPGSVPEVEEKSSVIDAQDTESLEL